MSCCGGNCGCGAGCKCGNGCGGCKMFPDVEATAGAAAMVMPTASHKGDVCTSKLTALVSLKAWI
ncbi:hypothetical protein TRIUR3_09069 [Triticum urartu]|uniref:Metallothionein-like protein n=1 Tax=Triticum urartu TaxID=4572 RepID=M8A9X3_TRIUA|nr:hypothetical protein TRIUR3_09069 [Triticum urartu]